MESKAGRARATVWDRYRPGLSCEAEKWEPDTETRTWATQTRNGGGGYEREKPDPVGTSAPAAETQTKGGGRFQLSRTPQARSDGATGS